MKKTSTLSKVLCNTVMFLFAKQLAYIRAI